MDSLPKDALVLLAMELNYADILKFCNSSKKINKYICQNTNFWRNKTYITYPFIKDLNMKYNLNKDFKKLFSEFSIIDAQIKNVLKFDESDYTASGYKVPSFIKPELVEFFIHADIGYVGTKIPLNYLLWLILSKGIISKVLAYSLLVIHLQKHQFIENGKNIFMLAMKWTSIWANI